jgi:hypothetical protein
MNIFCKIVNNCYKTGIQLCKCTGRFRESFLGYQNLPTERTERGQACIIALWDYCYILPIIVTSLKLNRDVAHNSLVAPCRHQI